jgi:Fe-S cluster assembly scaffold protein SufB
VRRPWKRVALGLALAAPVLVLTGCETTAEKSAKLERAAKRLTHSIQAGLKITHPSTVVNVLDSEVVHGSEGAAVVLTLHNSSSQALADVPIAVTVKDAKGASVYSNATPGLAKTLTSIALLAPRATATWIDDQIPTAAAASVSAEVGEGTAARGVLPKLAVHGVQLAEETAEGTLANGSSTAQSELVVYAVARRGGRVVAAGRAVLASVPAGASTPFQVFFVGDPKGARLQLTAPPTSVG